MTEESAAPVHRLFAMFSKRRSIICLTWGTEHERHQREQIGRYEHTPSDGNHQRHFKSRSQAVKDGPLRSQSSSNLIIYNRPRRCLVLAAWHFVIPLGTRTHN
jgi:hypothetical protein